MEDLKDIITNIGAFAGFAAVVGLAVLAMLYFSQARDVRRLREWAGRAPEREAEVEQIASSLAAQAVADMMAAMPEAAVPEAEAPAVEVQAVEPDAPPGEPDAAPLEPVETDADAEVAAAAEQAGEQPSTEWSPESVPLIEPDIEPGAAPDAAPLEPVEAVAAAEAAAGEVPAAEETEPVEPAIAASTTVGQPTQEVNVLELDDEAPDATRPSRLAPSTPAAIRAPGDSGVTGPRLPLPPLPEYRSTAAESIGTSTLSAREASREFDRMFEDEEPAAHTRSSRTNRAPFYVAGVLVLAFGALLLYTQVSGDSSSDGGSTANAPARQNPSGSDPRVNRPAVQVVVLNGTPITGLAAIVGDQIDQAGFTLKSVGNRGDNEDRIQSIVYYTEGNKLEAQEVAKELSIDTVKEADADVVAAAGGSVPVVVVAGSDREQ